MPGRFALKQTLLNIWHAPDNFRLMEPLPPLHRRGIIAGFALVIVGFLLPSGNSTPEQQVTREAQLDLQSQSQPQQGSLQQPLPPIVSSPPVNDPGQAAPVAPEIVQEDQPDEQPQPQRQVQIQPQSQSQAQSVPEHATPGIEQQWRTYRVEPGKTLAQLFRDHNLPATEVYAMSKVEGAGKPLSSLQAGQMVQVRQNANGVVTGLTVDNGSGQQVLFTRQPDGSYIRVR